ncbi:ubiquinone biosynthesis methyltransferase UbiE [Zhengella mangrovi]|uniref:Ubiquinone biosynthesis methyltransferase UbiE n=1 Tax=Zhengella mangrovi TaxID=1982044 RepID=A0A2G1QGN0_9HYPH|nr:methyltransferase domain-containing protein [Zhengella mangrovi]PHP64621.1 ubiquinone biosynthesis methyltransferase UbiE [Zhengella mangrovi]
MPFSTDDIEPFNDFEKNGWEKAAEAYHDHWGPLSAQSAVPMLRGAKVRKGARVLDVATGAGYVAAAAKSMGAIPVGLDFSRAQVELARQVYPDIEFTEGNAQDLPFNDLTFDAVVIGFGMNHLAEPEKAAREAWRVLKPGGAFAFSVWADPVPGEGFGIVLSAIERLGIPNAKLPAAPPYFRFADPDEVKAILIPAGFKEISTTVTPQFWRHSSPDQVFDAFNEGAVRATAMLRAQPEEVRARIRDVIRSEVRELKKGDEFVIPVPASLSVGFKPS